MGLPQSCRRCEHAKAIGVRADQVPVLTGRTVVVVAAPVLV